MAKELEISISDHEAIKSIYFPNFYNYTCAVEALRRRRVIKMGCLKSY